MAKIKSNLAQLAASLKLPISGPGSLVSIGEFMAKRIKGFTRLGYSLALNPNNPKENKLKALNPAYVKRRRFWPQGLANPPRGGLGISFSPGRSQLTASGQMLEAISYVVNPGKNSVRVFVKSTRRDDGKNNADIAKKNANDGRPFIGIDRVGLETIKTRYVSALLRNARRK